MESARRDEHAPSGVTTGMEQQFPNFLVGNAIDRSEMAVDAAQQRDQRLTLAGIKAVEQRRLARQRNPDDAIMDAAALRGERDRMAAAVMRITFDCDEATLAQQCQSAADRAFVEADDVADARGGNARFDRQQRQDAPFRDVDSKIGLIKRGRAARQFVGDKGDQRRHVAIEIKRSATGRRGGRIGQYRMSFAHLVKRYRASASHDKIIVGEGR